MCIFHLIQLLSMKMPKQTTPNAHTVEVVIRTLAVLASVIDSLYGIGSLWRRVTLGLIGVKTEFVHE